MEAACLKALAPISSKNVGRITRRPRNPAPTSTSAKPATSWLPKEGAMLINSILDKLRALGLEGMLKALE
ncbi:hypothetical protein DFAR_3710039 [Desulfarculales bacterium]